MKRLFKGASIVTCNEAFDVIENGMLAIDDHLIDYVGPYDADYEASFGADTTIIARNKILMPGLINTHTHLPMTLLRGYGSDLPLRQWLEEKMWPAEAKLTEKDIVVGSQVAIAEMLLSGTTTFMDMYFFEDVIAEVVKETGIRAMLCRGILSDDTLEQRIRECYELHEKYHGQANGRITTMMAPHAEYTNTDESLRRTIEVAKDMGVGIQIHLAETQREVNECIEKRGCTPVEYLRDLGLFDVHTVAAHCVDLREQDIAILKENNVHVAHNPTSNLKLASGIAPVQEMLNAGINVALGTDGASSNNNLDMMEEMHIAALVGKGHSGDPTALNAQTVLHMATLHGAKALGLAHMIGSLEKGKCADVIMIDQSNPFFMPKRELINNLVYSGGRAEIEMTMVDGRILMERGCLKTVDLEEVAGAFEESVVSMTS